MNLKSQFRSFKRDRKMHSAGGIAGLYVKPEKNSPIQFPCRFIGDVASESTLNALNRILDNLFKEYGERKIQWYVERSYGLDVKGNVAWGNLDLTDMVVP